MFKFGNSAKRSSAETASVAVSALELADLRGQVKAIGRSQAVIEFTLEGIVSNANDHFLHAVGYTLEEIRGQHHRLFVDPAEREQPAYQAFWHTLARGEYLSGQFRRFGKGGREVWLQASYNPIFNSEGKPFKVVKYCADITAQKTQAADFEGQVRAIDKAQAVIEFDLDGTIRNANENFLHAVGYTVQEIRGRHHRMFVTPEYAESAEYRAFWAKLGRGEYDAGQYRRVAKGGRELWLQASYNPIFDASGRATKVVKYASDVTSQVHLTERLATLVDQIRTSAGEIQQSAEEISRGNSSLSERVQEQAASLQQTNASMTLMTSAVKSSAENARQANALAGEARGSAERGGKIMSDAVTAMQGISEASNRIADIIGVIDSIAFQTNLLALNAAVEAARAGEQGRGFAVVASEVRSLAGRSASAAKEIKTLINDSTARVADGSRLVEQSGSTLTEIVTSVKKVADIIGEISAASEDQAAGIEQVGRSVNLMEDSTQQNAALVEQAAAASESIVQQVRELNASVVDAELGASTPASTAGVSGAHAAASAAAPVAQRPVAQRWRGAA